MSGPKTSSYSVEQNRLIEQRALASALGRCEALRIQLDGLNAEIRAERAATGGQFTDVPASHLRPIHATTSSEAQRLASSLQDELSRDRSRFTEEATAVRVESMLTNLRRGVEGTTVSAADVLAEHQAGARTSESAPAADEASSSAERVESAARRILGRIDASVGQDDREALLVLAETATTTVGENRAESLLAELRLQVTAANKAARRSQADATEAAQLLQTLDGLEGTPVAGCLELLNQVVQRRRELDDALRDRVRAAADDATRSADREYATSVMGEALRELGFEVQEGFATLVVDEGMAHFQRPEWGDYAVRVRLDEDHASLNFNMIREDGDDDHGAAQRVRDEEMETSWCSDFDRIGEALAAKGVRLQVERQLPAGQVEVQVVKPGAVTPRRAARSATSARHQHRSPKA